MQWLCCHSKPAHDMLLGSITCARRCCAGRGVSTKQLSVDALSISGAPHLVGIPQSRKHCIGRIQYRPIFLDSCMPCIAQ